MGKFGSLGLPASAASTTPGLTILDTAVLPPPKPLSPPKPLPLPKPLPPPTPTVYLLFCVKSSTITSSQECYHNT